MGLIRLVIIPFLMLMSDDYLIDNYPIGTSNINEGTYLIVIEYIVGSIFIFLLMQFVNKKTKVVGKFSMIGSKGFYYFFLVICLCLFITYPSVRESISFLVIKTDASGRMDENIDSVAVLARTLIQFGLVILFLLSSYRFYRKYKIQPKLYYIIIPLILGAVNISIIIGERRSYQIYTLLSIIAIITLLFKRHSKVLNTILIILGGTVFLGVTLYKELYIFNFSSYFQAFSSSNLKNINLADKLQAYFYGPHNVGGFIEYTKMFGINIKDYTFDMLRSTFGINIIIPDNYYMVSQNFNALLYNNSQLTGHLISSSAYGFGVFGPFFPLVLIINISFIAMIEYLLNRTQSIEIYFVLFYVLMRMVFNIFSNTPQLINHASMILIVYGIVILISYLIKKIFKPYELKKF